MAGGVERKRAKTSPEKSACSVVVGCNIVKSCLGKEKEWGLATVAALLLDSSLEIAEFCFPLFFFRNVLWRWILEASVIKFF